MKRREFLKLMMGVGTIPLMGSAGSGRPARRILLLRTNVAGIQYYSGLSLVDAGYIAEGQRLILRREPDNPYDWNAIEVFTERGDKVGYIPRDRNEVLASMMDQGISVYAVVYAINRDTIPWDMLHVEVYMEV